MTGKRKPAAFVLGGDEGGKARGSGNKAGKEKQRKPAVGSKALVVEASPAPSLPDNSGDERAMRAAGGLKRAFRWGRVLVFSISALVTMWAGAALQAMIADLMARSPLLGWTALALAALAVLALVVIVAREVIGLMRLRRVTRLHRMAQAAVDTEDEEAISEVLKKLTDLYSSREDMKWPLQRLKSHGEEIMPAAARLQLAERELLAPLDEEASRIISATSRQVAVMTAIIPMAALDMALVAARNLTMLRRLAALYGGRPGLMGGLRLARMVMTHLVFTGGLALTDSLLQNVLGKGLAGRLSARFGEGAVNGILTARVGMAALDLVRPLPFSASPRPSLSDYAKGLFSRDNATH